MNTPGPSSPLNPPPSSGGGILLSLAVFAAFIAWQGGWDFLARVWAILAP